MQVYLVLSSIKKSVSKKRKKKEKLQKMSWEKLWKKSWKISLFMCTSAESFSYQVSNQFAIFVWCKILLGFDCNTCILSILLVCIKSEISLRMCLIHLYSLYLVASTRHWSYNLDCDLALQYLEFRLHSLWIILHQAPHKSHCHRNADLVFA